MSYYENLIAAQSEMSLNRLGFDITKIEQGTEAWKKSRLGVITASRASDLIATGRGGKGHGKARESYLLSLVAEVATGQAKDQDSFKQTEWGHEYESHAREIFSFHAGAQCNQIPFIYANERMRYGCSPDGIADDFSGVEIKSPYDSAVYLDFLVNGEIKPEYIDQCQFSMFVTGLNYWHFCNYDPRMKISSFHAVTIERDEAKMKVFSEAVEEMIFDMDKILEKIGMKFGDQWK